MRVLITTIMLTGLLAGCTHKVEIAAKEPITINTVSYTHLTLPTNSLV